MAKELVRKTDGSKVVAAKGGAAIKKTAAKQAGAGDALDRHAAKKHAAKKHAAKKHAKKHAGHEDELRIALHEGKHGKKHGDKKDKDREKDGKRERKALAKSVAKAFHHLQRASAVISLIEPESGGDLKLLLHAGIEIYREVAPAKKHEQDEDRVACAVGLLAAAEHLAMAGLYAARGVHQLAMSRLRRRSWRTGSRT